MDARWRRGLMIGFAHLHVRSGFSWGYGAATPEELVERAAGSGVDALALTDRDTLAGIPRLMQACTGTGVSPIVGAEITMETKGVRGHVVLLAESGRGYRSLCKLITSYRLDAEDRHNPICPLPTLLEHAEGLLCLTGSIPFGLLPSMLLSRDSTVSRGARRLATLLLDAFGDGLHMEISDDRTEGLAAAHGACGGLRGGDRATSRGNKRSSVSLPCRPSAPRRPGGRRQPHSYAGSRIPSNRPAPPRISRRDEPPVCGPSGGADEHGHHSGAVRRFSTPGRAGTHAGRQTSSW